MDEHKLEEMYALVKDNNKMLHGMRRHAFVAGILKFVGYALMIAVPLWFYWQYMQPAIDQMMNTAAKMQTAGKSAEQKMADFQQMITDFKNSIPGF